MRGFTGIDVPDDIKREISKLQASMPLENVSVVRMPDLHITLHFFQDISDAQAEKAKEIIQLAKPGRFEIAVQGVSYFGTSAIRTVFAMVVDPGERILSLHEKLGRRFLENNIRYDQKVLYVPHITIARCRRYNPWLKKFIEDRACVPLGKFEAHSIFLKKSVLTGGGPVHTTLIDHEI